MRAPYAKGPDSRFSIQSRAGHVKPGPKQGGPPSKAEHSPMTDSEPVPRGKGEKYPEQGGEIDPEPARLQAVGAE